MIYWIILIGFMLLGYGVQARLKNKFKKYSKEMLTLGLSGKEIAEKMLHDNGIYDVRVISTPGRLTDHYNPRDKTVNLSEAVYNERSIAAAAVAAHECGHAVQHAKAYSWLQFRSAMVPVVNFSSQIMGLLFMVMMFGGLVMYWFPFTAVIWVIVGAQAAITLFSVVTLPVEFDASKRALVWLESTGTMGRTEHEKAKDALNAAASTYVVSALAAITQLAYWVMVLLGSRD